jgi:hypothetical protein
MSGTGTETELDDTLLVLLALYTSRFVCLRKETVARLASDSTEATMLLLQQLLLCCRSTFKHSYYYATT